MPVRTRALPRMILLTGLLAAVPAGQSIAGATTFNVAASCCSNYTIDGLPDPPLTLTRGLTYTFNLDVSGHPFFIKTIPGPGGANTFDNGVSGNGDQGGVLTFVVPLDAPANLFYNCALHGQMGGTIAIVDGEPRFSNGFE